MEPQDVVTYTVGQKMHLLSYMKWKDHIDIDLLKNFRKMQEDIIKGS